MGHGELFTSAQGGGHGLGCLTLSGKQSEQLRWGKGVCLFPSSEISLPSGVSPFLSPPKSAPLPGQFGVVT